MKKLIAAFLTLLTFALISPAVQAKGDDFKSVVKTIERSYLVKHKGLPFFARIGIKTVAKAASFTTDRGIGDFGSLRIAYFENQKFNHAKGFNSFRAALRSTLPADWRPVLQVLSLEGEQVYVYLREESGDKFKVMLVHIGREEGSVVQVKLSARTLAQLLMNPEESTNNYKSLTSRKKSKEESAAARDW